MNNKNYRKLNIKDYSKNASKNFSYTRLIIYLVISIALDTLLVISMLKQDYKGIGLVFCLIVFMLVLGFIILNIMAIIEKIKK